MASQLQYATSAAITITLTSLAHSLTAGRESTVIDNTTNVYMDAILQVKFKLLTGTPGVDQAVYVYVHGSEDGATFTDGNLTGVDAALTLRAPTNMTMLQTIFAATTGGATFVGQPISVALAFGGMLPRKWGVVIRNATNLAFSATAGDHVVRYTGIKVANV
jgi:hypothetical protein